MADVTDLAEGQGEAAGHDTAALVARVIADLDASGGALLEDMRARLPQLLAGHRARDASFRRRCRRRWKEGLDLLQAFIVMSQEFGSNYNDRSRPAAFRQRDHRFEAIVLLHARGVRVANEMQALMHEGFPDGALGR